MSTPASTNPFKKIALVAETVGKDIVKGVEYPIEFLVKAEAVIASAIKDQPEVKTAILGLVTQAQTVIADSAGVLANKGVDFSADSKTLADAEAFFEYFKNTFIPMVEQIYAEVKADIQ